MKVLIVDDQHEVRRMIRAAVESQFPHVSLQDVPSAEEAMILLAQGDTDLLVVDVRLAGMSGLEMIEKARRRQPKLNIVVITGLTDPTIQQQLDQAPIQGWFRKPLPMEAFLNCLSNLLRGDDTPPSEKPSLPAAGDDTPANLPPPPLEELCQQLGLSGLCLTDLQGKLLACSHPLPDSLQPSRLMETFLQAEAEIKRLLSHYGLEGIPFPGVYLSEESAVAQVQWENFRLLYCIDRKNLPQRSSALIIAVLQKGEELLETLQRDPAPLAQFPLSHLPESAAEEYPTLPTDSTLEALLQNPSLTLSQANQLDEFWEEAQANSDWSDHDSDSQTFHFNQARQLGILPPDENNDAS